MFEEIPLEQLSLSVNETQCLRRESFDPAALDELAASVKRQGVLQPIMVRRQANDARPDHDKLVIIAGERRYLAADKAGLTTIPAVVREMSDEDVIEVQLMENLQRADLDPLQEAEGYRELIDHYGHPVDEVNARIGKSRSYVYKRLQLLQLTQACRAALIKSEISVGLAMLLARIPNTTLQNEALADLTTWPDERPTLSAAAAIIRDNYMLSLADAPFPTDDPDLVRSAPVCAQCPKRTGNQSELFDDIAAKDLCTDPECFQAKKTNHNKRLAKQWKAEGRPVIEGKKAKQAMPYGPHFLNGYEKLDSSVWAGGQTRPVRQLVKDELDKTELLITPDGEAVEVIPTHIVRRAERALDKTAKATPQGEDPAKVAERRVREENAFRLELYRAIREQLEEVSANGSLLPTLEEIAIHATERLWHDYRKLLCKFHGLEPVKRKSRYGAMPPDYDKPLAKRIQQRDEDPRLAFLDVLIMPELKTSAIENARGRQSYPRLKKLAAAVGVDPKAIKRRLKAEATAKTKAKQAAAKAKPKAKRPARKKKAVAK